MFITPSYFHKTLGFWNERKLQRFTVSYSITRYPYYGPILKSSKGDAYEISYSLFHWLFFNRIFIIQCQCFLLYSQDRSLVVSGTGRLPLPPYILERSHLLRRGSSYLFNLRILVLSHSYSLNILVLWSLKSWSLIIHLLFDRRWFIFPDAHVYLSFFSV